jgi:hypothetical protein
LVRNRFITYSVIGSSPITEDNSGGIVNHAFNSKDPLTPVIYTGLHKEL